MKIIRPVLGVLLTLVLLGASASASAAGDPPAFAASGDRSSLRVTGLTTENADNPLNVDAAQPRLGWRLESPERNQAQTAYRVLVASSLARLAGNHADVWDSGKVRSGQSVNVSYRGPALRSRARYFWKVTVWDRSGDASGWSDPAWWETALLQPSDWHAQWIGQPLTDIRLDLDGDRWIWFPEGNPAQSAPAGTRYFRSRFDLPAGRQVVQAALTTTADNGFTAYVNGGQVSTGSDWTRAVRVDVTGKLTPGPNLLAFAASNLGGPGSLIARLRIDFTSGDPLVIDTGAQVKAANAEQAGWQTPGFDDSSWPTALETAGYGDAPWGTGVQLARPSPAPAPLLRKEFSVGKPIARARAYVSGLGYYVLRIDGQPVGNRVLDPTYTQYEKTVLYTTYDVTSQLRRGPNALAVALSPGFYYYNSPKLLMQVVIDYTDGSSQVVGTDGTWQIAPGPTFFATTPSDEVFGGETYDARLDPRGWDQPGFDASAWKAADVVPAPGGQLVAQAVQPVTVAESFQPTGAVTQPRPGTYVVDMGRTLTGWIRLRTSGAAGTKVTMQYGEKLRADGTVNGTASPPRPRWQRDEYIFRGAGVETWEPAFTFKSFRYVQFDGLAAAPAAGVVTGRVVHSAVPSAGEFSSASPLYNQIDQAMRRTTLNGLLGYPAIDPGNEKNGWTGDTQLITPSMIDSFDANAFLAKWLGDIRDGQRPDGSISMIDPIRDGCCYAWAPEWTGAYPIVAWELYVKYADRGVLQSHYDALKKYLGWQTGALVDGIAPASTWGDWYSPGYSYGPEDRRLSATAYVYRQLTIMADIARVLGHSEDAAGYLATAGQVRQRFNETFFNAGAGQYVTATDPGYRQTSNALPVAFGIVPDQDRKAVVDGLAADVRAHGGHLNTGILGTPALLDVLTRNGYVDLAHGIASQTTFPSWGEWLNAGADTLWEQWGLGARSRNHPMFGTIDDWFYRDVAGLSADPSVPGYQHAIIQPWPTPTLSTATAKYASRYGEIKVAWLAQADRFTLDVRIPVNATATVRVPVTASAAVSESGRPAARAPGVRYVRTADGYAEFEIGSGNYHFVARTPAANAPASAE